MLLRMEGSFYILCSGKMNDLLILQRTRTHPNTIWHNKNVREVPFRNFTDIGLAIDTWTRIVFIIYRNSHSELDNK